MSFRSTLGKVLFLNLLFVLGQSCASPGREDANNNTNASTEQSVTAQPERMADEEPAPEIDPTVLDRLRTEKWSGDLDGLIQRRYIRALVLYNKTSFFYDGPQPRGVSYESLKEFERFLNRKLDTGKQPVYMVFLPVTRDEGIKRLADGRGDIAVANIPIIPKLQEISDFSDPVRDQAKEIIVTGPSAPPISTIDDLAGQEVFTRRKSRYWLSLVKLNEQFKASGKPVMTLKEADENLEDDDILNIVGSGGAGITVMDDLTAGLWAKVFDGLNVHNDVQVASGEQIGWAVQKGTPKFLALVNEFVKDHKEGTSFGNTIILRYLKDTKFAKNNTA